MSIRDFMFAVFTAAFWGCNYVAVAITMQHYPPFLMSSVRFVAVGLLLLPFLNYPRQHWKMLTAFSVCLGTIHFALVFLGMYRGIDPPTAVLTAQMGVPFACVLGTIFLNDRLGPWRSCGLIIAFLGLIFIVDTPDVENHFVAFLLILVGSLAWGASNILAKKLTDMPFLSIVGWMSWICAPQQFILSLLMETNQCRILQSAPLVPTLGLIYSIIFSSIVAYGMWYYLLGKYSVSRVVPFSLLVPVFGIIASRVLLGSELNWQMLVGGAITMSGVSMIVLHRPKVVSVGADGV